MQEKELDTFYPASRNDWRLWLEENHKSKQSIWLICYTKKSDIPTISWSELVDEALCFGWIDSTRKSMGGNNFIQLVSKRKPKSTWSRINKEKIQQLIQQGLMTQAGYESIETAKQNGSWVILDEVEELKIPEDLEGAFRARQGSKDYFVGLSKSVRKIMLQWIVLAKRPETRQKRIEEIVDCAARYEVPEQFRNTRPGKK